MSLSITKKSMKLSILVLLIFASMIMFNSIDVFATTIHGAVYDMELNELNDVILEVNSTPTQRYVVKNNSYVFELNQGFYEIMIKWKGDCISECVAYEHVEISEDGEYIYDLFAFFELDLENEEIFIDVLEEDEMSAETIAEQRKINWYWAVTFAAIFLIGLAIYLYYVAKDNQEESEVLEKIERAIVGQHEFDVDIKMVIDVLRKEGGRITQRELRKQIPLSEAKVSLMITELEAKGKIKKIKKGRGNIIKLIK